MSLSYYFAKESGTGTRHLHELLQACVRTDLDVSNAAVLKE